ncbi:MipA/OmpV family protein [Siccirubricoccus phaeus]|uniref:MipA/OmpV family protein n=1 Tax=Siccirubricoccus phaeus TaxID=2595053 RepID=UPI00165C6069|nr:MipA/OmpV family protein [Siccirubricoccus phaeus]
MIPNDARPAHAIYRVVRWAALLAAIWVAMGMAGCMGARAQPVEPPLGSAQAPATPGRGAWTVRLGAGALIGPAYPGSEGSRVRPLPLVDIAYRANLPGLDTIFLNTQQGLGIVALRYGPFSLGGSLGFAPGRDQDLGGRLRGMGDIDAGPRGSLFLHGNFGPLLLSVQADRAFGDQEGTTVTLGATYRRRLTPSLSLAGHLGASWADEDHMQEWFGVTPLQASRTAFPSYRPEAGFRNVTASLSGNYLFSERWVLNATIGVTRLLGDAADSPIVQRETQPFGLLGLSYRF